MATDRTIAITVAVRNVQDAINALKRVKDGGEQALDAIIAKASGASAGLSGVGEAAGRASGGFQRLGPLVQQAGFQIGDFAVQVASGQNALIAFAQQGSQLAGLFGPTGAVVGAILGVGAVLVSRFVPDMDAAGDATGTARDRLIAYGESLEATQEKVANFAAKLREMSAAQLQGLAAKVAAEQEIAAGTQRLLGRFAVTVSPSGIRAGNQPGRDPELDAAQGQIDQEAQRRAEDRGRDLVKERQNNLAFLREQADGVRELQRRADEADRERTRSAERLRADQARLDQARLDDSNAALAEEVQRFDRAQEEKRRSAEEFNRFLLGIENDVADKKAADAARAKDAADREAERAAQQQADILAQPYKDLAGQISSIVSRGIFDGLTDANNFDFGDVAQSFADALGTAVSGTIGTALTQPLNQAVAGLGQQLASALQSGDTASLSNFASQNGALLAAGAGFVGGSLLAQATGGNSKFGGLGGAIGGGAGFLIGNAILPGVGGFIGAGIGSAAGGALGGLFGSENNLGNDRSAQTFNSARGIIYSDKSFSPENRNITSGIADEVQSLIDLFGDLGGNVASFNLRLEAGNKSGITVNGRKYATAAEALAASLELLIGNTTGLSATQQTILGNTKGKTAQEISADLAFGDTFDQLVFAGREVDRAFLELNRTFDAAVRQAEKLGLSTDELNAAREREAQTIAFQYDQQQRNIYAQLAALRGDQSLQTQLYVLDTQMRELAKAAEEAGVPIEQVTAAHEEAARRLTESYNELIATTERQIVDQQRGIEQQVRGVDSFFSQLIDPLKAVLANDNRLSPLAQIAQERERFRSLADLAQGGDIEALRQLSGSATSLQGLASRFLGSSGQGADIAREIEQVLGSIIGGLDQQKAETLADLPGVQRETTAMLAQTFVDQISLLIEEQEKTRRELRNLKAA